METRGDGAILKNNQMDHLLASMVIIGDDTIQRTQLKHRQSLVDTFNLTQACAFWKSAAAKGIRLLCLQMLSEKMGMCWPWILPIPITVRRLHWGKQLQRFQNQVLAAASISNSGQICSTCLKRNLMWRSFPIHPGISAIPDSSLLIWKKCGAWRSGFASPSLNFSRMEQRPHFAATAILALYSEFIDNDGNIQHVFDSLQLQGLLVKSGVDCAEDVARRWELFAGRGVGS